MDELTAEFVNEAHEMLQALDGDLATWAGDPGDRARIEAIHRFLHTIKGNCGFIDQPVIGRLARAAEQLLEEPRAGLRHANPVEIAAVIAAIGRIGTMIDALAKDDPVTEDDLETLVRSLQPGGAD